MTVYCNAYGAERVISRPYAGIQDGNVLLRPECHAPAIHRVRWVCDRGHKGPEVELCDQHFAEFTGQRSARYEGMEGDNRALNGRVLPIPFNLRREVQVCGGCAAEAPECDNPEHAAMMRGRPGRCGCRQRKATMRLEFVS